MSNKYCGKTKYMSPEVSNKYTIFDAKKNDIWCLGVSLYMLLTNTAPWQTSLVSDQCCSYMINGFMKQLLQRWKLVKYVDDQAIDLLQHIFQSESKRYTLSAIKSHQWMIAST